MTAATRSPSAIRTAARKFDLLALLGLLFIATGSVMAKERAEYAREFKAQLAEKIMPYWYDTAQDRTNGGYLLADHAHGRGIATEKQLVTQSRMIWGFSHAHRKGFSDARRNYLQAAEQGYRFLINHFLDTIHGGYYWKTDLTGKVLNDRKIIYGEAFVIYELVELYRAGGNKEALQRARDLHHLLLTRAHDAKNDGWIEHFRRDWQPIVTPDPATEVEVPGLKSAHAHLHLMEAFTELYLETHDPAVRKSLAESLRLNARYFYPRQPGRSSFHRRPDWRAVTDLKSAGLSYGHNVEFA